VRRVTLDPFTGRVTEYYANAAYCRLAGGASVEEHLAAVAARALPEHVTQLDHLLRCDRAGGVRRGGAWRNL
jgi:hypothetical protein